MTLSDADDAPFPTQLTDAGLNEETLEASLALQSDWCVNDVPTVGFYRCLHKFLVKWPKSRSMTKTAVGKFYMGIDHNFKQKGSRPDNIYRFVEKIILSDEPDSSPMNYGIGYQQIHHLRRELKDHTHLIQDLESKLTVTDTELDIVKRKVDSAEEELVQAKRAAENATHKVAFLEQKSKAAIASELKAIKRYEQFCQDHMHYEDELLEECSHLSDQVKLLEPIAVDHSQIVFHTIENGKQFTPAIRALYYQLLADQVPLSKIKTTIKAVIKCFFPSADVSNLRLPSETCAKYMRQHELKTVSMVHKARVISQASSVHLNSDGTTKFQRKIGGIAFNGLVISVNELPDGSAESIIADMSREIEKMRDIAHMLKISNADKINWTLVSAATSDSASTQKKFNHLLQEKREEDEQRFGPASGDAMDVIENFCAMHLGVNLRKAFLDGLKTVELSSRGQQMSERREYHQTDTLVHEFCKLFGRHGVPEYGCGASGFLDYLNLMLDRRCSDSDQAYYAVCSKVSLDRQVGSRYFVTAHNACKILFLTQAACEFLEYTGKSTDGNKLECDVYQKLHDPDELSRLKADALMFHHVYADLMMLAKSTELSKSTWDMNVHYLELAKFLEAVQMEPQLMMKKDLRIFPSEECLYAIGSSTNHRARSKYSPIEKRLFQSDSFDDDMLFPLLASGAAAMKKKLYAYAKNQLPGGLYWDPEGEVKEILKKLPPTNDLCESLLGLNDHLTTSIPNLCQLTRSNLIETKKNKTMQWLDELPQEERDQVVNFAVRLREKVKSDYREEREHVKAQRSKKLMEQKQRRDALKRRAQEELNKLDKLHLITSVAELREAIANIDESELSAAKKRDKKMSLLKDQINIRKKVYKENIRIPFSQGGKKRPVATIASELMEFMASSELSSKHCDVDPATLVGKSIEHKFELDGGEFKWFRGFVIDYDAKTSLHEVVYEGEEEHCHFNLLEDLFAKDLRVI